MFLQDFIKLSAALQQFMSYRVQRNKKNSDDAENNTALASTGSKKLTAIYAQSLSMRSANLFRRSPRPDAFIWRQVEPRLNAALAALTAFSTSAYIRYTTTSNVSVRWLGHVTVKCRTNKRSCVWLQVWLLSSGYYLSGWLSADTPDK